MEPQPLAAVPSSISPFGPARIIHLNPQCVLVCSPKRLCAMTSVRAHVQDGYAHKSTGHPLPLPRRSAPNKTHCA